MPERAEEVSRAVQELRASGLAEGLEKGMEKGMASSLRLQLEQRFGAIPPELTKRIGEADLSLLERWVGRVLVSSLWEPGRRKLDMLNAAHTLQDLRVPPGNKLEKLRGDLKAFESTRNAA